jgi:glycosyltransferase involved in cell wall biosynthesis
VIIPPRRALVLLAPIAPAATGNGLAMRVGAHLRALAGRYDVRVVVVPVAGGATATAWAELYASSAATVLPGDASAVRAASARLVADARWRERLLRAQPFPAPVTYASPVLAAAVCEAAGGVRGARVHAIRAYLAPLAVAVAEQAGAPWATLDLDDDDEHLLEQAGRHDDAAAYGRILETFGAEFAWVSLASEADAARVAQRHGLRSVVVPNSVDLPAGQPRRSRGPGDPSRLLFVANLTYAPNIEAAELLVGEILPRVRALAGADVALELVGRFETGGAVEELAATAGVTVRGHVDDLAEAYAGADVVVVPLLRGSGTRIKLLEALAAGVPAVTTAVGAAGLGAEDGRHLLIAEGAQALAEAVARVLLDERLAGALARAGRELVERSFSSAVIGSRLAGLTAALDSGDETARAEV